MSTPPRKISFVIASSDHGTLILNRLDYNVSGAVQYGVGIQLLDAGSFDAAEVELAGKLLGLRRHYFGDGVTAIDCGANIGVHTIEWAKQMTGWGKVVAIEAQERIYYALAGNIAINNCFNATAIHAAVSDTSGVMRIPLLDYQKPASFGSLELTKLNKTEAIGQTVDYAAEAGVEVRMTTIDAMNSARCDFIKIDVEGMEMSVLAGAAATISKHSPIIMAESIKTDKEALRAKLLALGYRVFEVGINFLAIHSSDPCLPHITPAP